MKAKTAIKARGFVSDGAGVYRPYEDLSGSEKKAFAKTLVQRMGDTINRYASVHLDVIPGVLKCAVKDV